MSKPADTKGTDLLLIRSAIKNRMGSMATAELYHILGLHYGSSDFDAALDAAPPDILAQLLSKCRHYIPTTDDPLAGIEIRFHSAMPSWCKLMGLNVKAVPECEGGGFMIDSKQAMAIMDLIEKARR